MIDKRKNIIDKKTASDNPALLEFTQKLRGLYSRKIEELLLFGSVARGDAGEDSDIDVLIVTKNNDRTLKNEITDLAFEMMLKYGVDIAPVIFNKSEWSRLRQNPTSFVYCVLSEGKRL